MGHERRELARFWAGVMAGFVLVVGGTLLALALIPTLFGVVSATVVGSGSMAPALRVGDVVLLDHVDARASTLESPTVVLADDPGRDRPLLHRIVGTSPDGLGYVTKGDANPEKDSTVVPPEWVRGTGRVVIPLVGTPVLWLQDGNLIPVALLVASIAGLAWFARFGWSDAYDPWSGHHASSPTPLTEPAPIGTILPARA